MSGERGRKMESSAGKMFLAAVRAPSESRRCWLKINSAARVGPDSCARTANMDAHQVLLAGRCGCSRWELVGRAGGSGRGKGAEEGEEEKEERPGAQPEGRGLPSSSRPPLPYDPDRAHAASRAGPSCQTPSFRSTPRSAHFTLPIPKKFFKRSLRRCPGHLAVTRVLQAGTRDAYLRPRRVLGSQT